MSFTRITWGSIAESTKCLKLRKTSVQKNGAAPKKKKFVFVFSKLFFDVVTNLPYETNSTSSQMELYRKNDFGK